MKPAKKTRLIIIALFILGVVLYMGSTVKAPGPVYCSLCGGEDISIPCILNLSTGLLSPLPVNYPGAVTGPQDGISSMKFQRRDNISVSNIDGIFSAMVSKSDLAMQEALFCTSCLDLISAVTMQGLVLVDAHDQKAPLVYPLTAATYSIREYTVDITEHETFYTTYVHYEGPKANLIE